MKKLVKNNVYWVGKMDWELESFHGSDYSINHGSSQNAYLIQEEKTVLIDTVWKPHSTEFVDNLASEIDLYKIDLINNMENDNITAYKQDDFIDLCRGPHVESTKELKFFKLLKVSGAYWKADANNKMLQRIYGICFENEEDLKSYLEFLEEAKKRDHRKLGKELNLFMTSDYGPGFPFWLPKGMTLMNELQDFWYKEHRKAGYEFIKTPIMLNKELWEVSGHWFNYKENMYTSVIDDKEYAIKPMNCPGGLLVYKNSLHSYKDLPLRVGELGLVHRHEASGALSGLFRVRMFTQDDAHIFMTENQIEDETVNLIKFFDKILKL